MLKDTGTLPANYIILLLLDYSAGNLIFAGCWYCQLCFSYRTEHTTMAGSWLRADDEDKQGNNGHANNGKSWGDSERKEDDYLLNR